MHDNFLNLLASYYELLVKLIVELDKIKNNPDELLISKFSSDIEYLYELHSKLDEIKKSYKINMFNLNNVNSENILIKNCKLISDIKETNKSATNLITKNINRVTESANSCQLYEIGLFAGYLAKVGISDNDNNIAKNKKTNDKLEEFSLFELL